MKWIESQGGPMILVPRGQLAEWNGASPTTPTVGDDYARACAVRDYLGSISVGGGIALVLGDTPDSTTVIASDLGPALVRWGFADSEADILEAVREHLPTAEILEEMVYQVEELSHVLFDSVFEGNEFEDSLELLLEVGTYRIRTRRHTGPKAEFLAHVFEQVPKP